MAPITKIKCESREEMRKVKPKLTGRSKEHDIKINRIKQVQKKVDDASKALIMVEFKDDNIKIKPNSGNFKAISDELMKLSIGNEIKNEGTALAIVADQHSQVNKDQIPFLVKTEFSVKNIKKNSIEKAVLHTYITTTCFMIQGKGRMYFYENLLKNYIENIMKDKAEHIIFMNKTLQSMNQGKRKMPAKNEPCDICGRMFTNQTGLSIHKKRMHSVDSHKAIKNKESLQRSDSIRSPPPKKTLLAIEHVQEQSDLPAQALQAVQTPKGPQVDDPQVPQPPQVKVIVPAQGQAEAPSPALQAPQSSQVEVLQSSQVEAEAPSPALQATQSSQVKVPQSSKVEVTAPDLPQAEPSPPALLAAQAQSIPFPDTMPAPMEGYELEDEIRRSKEEISKLKEQKQQEKLQHASKWRDMELEKEMMRRDFKNSMKESEAKYKALFEEKEKIAEEMVKQETENALKVEKLEADIEMIRLEATLKTFKFVNTQEKSEDDLDPQDEIEECIISVKCKERCEHLPCRMQTMRLQGGRRTTPADVPREMHTCPQCGCNVSTKNDLQKHMQRVHTKHPNCPFCQVGFFSQGALKSHIDNHHNENQERPSVISGGIRNAKPICVFNLQPRGCKKGNNCDFSHETRNQQPSFAKVRKLCLNGTGCTWKPRCRYVHPEDGETIPLRAPREGGRESYARPCHWSANECPRGGPGTCTFVHKPQPSNQGFATPAFSQLPPGYSMTEFPRLPAPRRPSIFQQNPQFSQ